MARYFIYTYLFFLLLPLAIHSQAPPLRVGMELSYPPFESICPDGAPCGISVDIASDLAKNLGRPMRVVNIPFIGLLPSLNTHKVDLVISSLTVTKEREKAVLFSTPYATIGLSLLISIHSPVHSIVDVNKPGINVVVKSGTSGEVYAAKYLPNATIRILDKEAMCVLEVVQCKADVFIYDQLSVYRNWQRNPSTTRANLASFQNEYWAIGVSKDNPDLLEKINEFLKNYKNEGNFEKLAEKYLSKELATFKEQGIPFIF